MLVIRLARGGRSKYPTYRIVAAESARAATGKFVEILGHYNPHTKELVIDKAGVEKRLSNGAQPSNTVLKLLQREKIELPAWAKLETRDRKPKKEPVEKPAPAPAAEAPAEAATEEAPAEEVAAEEPVTEEAPAEETPAEPAEAEEEPRVAEAATENAEAASDNATPAGKTETAEDTEAAAEAVEKTEAAGDAATQS